MSNEYDPILLLDKAHQLGLQVSKTELLSEYLRLEQLVKNHSKIQNLLNDLNNSNNIEIYNIKYEELNNIPLFTEYLDIQSQANNYLQDMFNIILQAISVNMSVGGKKCGGCNCK